MSAADKIAYVLKRFRAEDAIPALSHNPEDGLIFLDGGFLGAAFISPPMPGADDTTVERLRATLAMAYPPGTIIQIGMMVSPDIEPVVGRFASAREGKHVPPILEDMVDRRRRFILSGKEKPLIDTTGMPANLATVVVSIKIPCKMPLEDDELVRIEEIVSKFEEAMNTLGLRMQRLKAPEYLAILRRLFKMDAPLERWYDENRLLRDQVLSPGDRISLDKDFIRINDIFVKTLSVKHYPQRTSLARMAYMTGDPAGIDNQITAPHLLVLTLHYPDQQKKSAAVRAKSQHINYQAYGPMLRFVPKLKYKKEGIDVLIHAMEQGETLVEMSLTLHVFSEDKKKLSKLSGMLRAYYSALGVEVSDERYIHWPVFWNNLPLFPTSETIKMTHRFHTVGCVHAAQFAPILGEWTGTGPGGACLFLTRRNQPLLFDLYDSDTSYNGVIFAESGAGKSFLTQRIIVDYLSLGAKVWVIDVGRSYMKLCKALEGEFIEFSEQSRVCLNPFTHVKDIDDEADFLKALLAKMAAPEQGLDDYRYAGLEEAIKAVWGRLGPAMTISEVADYLLQQEDQRIKDMGRMLYPYTRHGSYGYWFDGENNLRFSADMVVLELEELKSRRGLQQVVLLQLIAKIQHEMYLSGADRPKLVVIDEAWDLLADAGTGKFMEHGYRRFRKYGGAALVVTQSINDLYTSEAGRAIAENSPFKIIMKQKGEAIEAVERTGRIALDPYGFRVMRTIHTVPGKYSEFMIHTDRAWGVGRLVEDRFSQVLFSTKGAERTEVLEAIERGVPADEAVKQFIEVHG